MKKYFGMACYLLLAITSCQKDDEAIIPDPPISESSNFFNLKTGNTWVYKRYRYNKEIDEFIFDGKMDTVYLEKELMLNGEKYFKQKSIDINGKIKKELVTVNHFGHLIGKSFKYYNNDVKQYLIHPGKDFNLSNYIRSFSDNYFSVRGNINYSLNPIQEIQVEGVRYQTYPFLGIFIPFEGVEYPKMISGFGQYFQENLGRIKEVCKSSTGITAWEARLVSHFNQPVKIKNDIQSQLEELYDEILEMANPQPCSDPAKWKFTSIGYKPCGGGSTHYIAYYADIDVKLFMKKISVYNQLEKKSTEGMMCIFDKAVPPIGIECTDNRPVLIYDK